MPDYLPDLAEAGTHNMPGIAGLHQGLLFVKKRTPEAILYRETRLLALAGELLSGVKGIRLYLSEKGGRQTGVLSFAVFGEDPELTAEKLGERGIAVRAGLHCAPLAHATAGSGGTVRLIFSAFNTEAEVYRAVRVLREILD